jgi:hypothetical protein
VVVGELDEAEPVVGREWSDEDYRQRDEALAALGIRVGRRK